MEDEYSNEELRAELANMRERWDAILVRAGDADAERNRVQDDLISSEHDLTRARANLNESREKVGRLEAELRDVRVQLKHIEAAHADLVARNALLRERPDLPVDRIPAHREMVRLQSTVGELRAEMTLRPTADDVAELDVEVSKLRELLHSSHEANTDLAAQVQTLTDERDTARQKATKFEEALGNALGELETLRAERATAKFAITSGQVTDGQTDRKAADIMIRTGMKKAGYVLQADQGAAIVHMGAVRWLSHEELLRVVHPGAPARDTD